jgi:hypothetical protein
MGHFLSICGTVFLLFFAGCSTTGAQNRAVAPPIPTPSPYGPGQQPPPNAVVVPPNGAPPATNIPAPPGSPPSVMAPLVSPELARVQATANRLYQANPWLTLRPQWIVSPNETPGLTSQGEQTAVISVALVHGSSDGQLAAAMSLLLGDMLACRQQNAQNATRDRREISPPPDYFQQRDGMSSTQALLQLDEIAKYRYDSRDLRRKEQQQQQAPYIDANTYAKQILVQAGYSELELNQVAPLMQRYPMVRPAGR